MSDAVSRRLESLGVSEAAERAYLELLTNRAAADLHPDVSAELESHGLVAVSGSRIVPLSARDLLDEWERDRAAETSRTVAEVDHLLRLHDAFSRSEAGFVEVLHGNEAVRSTFTRLQMEATSFLHSLERGPYLQGPVVVISDEQEQVSERGIRYRSLYRAQELQREDVRIGITQAIAMGEEARVYVDVPLRMMIADDRRALVVLPQPVDQDEWERAAAVDGLLVRESPPLDVLIRLFHSFWNRGTRLDALLGEGATEAGAGSGDPRHALSPEDSDVLELLATGLTDAHIARTLGVSQRTVQRRISNLEHRVGVQTRYLLGVEAARRGWI